ncbi:MAG TPA: hypothetical protein VFS43_19825 [Polyangiaceae bacterium]|nr:hypothetical protein [Polyangiaceae bacterium]
MLIMSRRPAVVQEAVEVDLPRPRAIDSADYLRGRDRIFAAMGVSLEIGGGPPGAAGRSC